ncbi:MAG: Lrp/AsnC family transcriptional regulator [Porphyromonadaceae bacterium]|nr:Lrp/AsnC family transcriptional regulator [Porphyromonadaceae bacterium]
MEKLNKLDLQILRIVSRNARMSIKDIAEECGSSRSAVNQRLQRLMASGVVKDPGYAVNPRAIGYNTCTYVGIRLERGSLYKDVVPLLQEIEEIVECHYTTGQYSILVKLYALDNRDLMRILNGIIQEIPGVTGTETLISLDLSFERSINIPKAID